MLSFVMLRYVTKGKTMQKQPMALIHSRRLYNKSATYSTQQQISVDFDSLWAAENTVVKFHKAIGIDCAAVIRDYYTNGPKGPALLVLVACNGSGWRRGIYLCMVEDENTEPMFFLDNGDSFAHIEVFTEGTTKQWQFPWRKEHHMPLAISYAEEAALNLLSGD